MKSYTRYLQLLQDLQFRIINPLQNTDPTGNFRFGDIEEINPLKKFIIDELRMADPGNIKLKLKKLKGLNEQFIDFDKNYPNLYEKSKDGRLKLNDLRKSLPLLQKKDQPDEDPTAEYVKTLYQSIVYRQKSLLDLINQTEDLLTDKMQINIASA
jgi:hypothetical protein